MTILNSKTSAAGTVPLARRLSATLGQATEASGAVLFPPTCSLCRRPLVKPAPLCSDCVVAIAGERARRSCPRCARSVGPYEVRDGQCGNCRDRFQRVAGTARVGPHHGALGKLLHHFKYGFQEHLIELIGVWLSEAVLDASWCNRIEAIVPVPTTFRRRVLRPFYTADALARFVSGRTGLPCLPLLRRIRGGRHQIGLSYTDRIVNVRGAFALRRGVVLRKPRLLLIDDVKTTGATLHECAKLLHRGGAGEVYAAVVVTAGHGRPMGYAPTT